MEITTKKNENSLPSKQDFSPALTRRANLIREKYGDFVTGFCVEFNNDAKKKIPDLVYACSLRTPTLRDIDIAYGEGSALAWMAPRLAETFAFLGLISYERDEKGKMKGRCLFTANQQIWCASRIIATRPDVTVAEVLQFFTRFEQGLYHIFNGYKHPNPQVITASFGDFLEDLDTARGIAQQRKNHLKLQQEAELAKQTAVPCPPDIMKRQKESGLPIPGNNDK